MPKPPPASQPASTFGSRGTTYTPRPPSCIRRYSGTCRRLPPLARKGVGCCYGVSVRGRVLPLESLPATDAYALHAPAIRVLHERQMAAAAVCSYRAQLFTFFAFKLRIRFFIFWYLCLFIFFARFRFVLSCRTAPMSATAGWLRRLTGEGTKPTRGAHKDLLNVCNADTRTALVFA